MLKKKLSMPDFKKVNLGNIKGGEKGVLVGASKILRGSNSGKIMIKNREFDRARFLKDNDIDGIVRIMKKDYRFINKKCGFLTHFNLEKTSHRVGNVYVLAKILKQGHYKSDGEEVLPNLEVEGCYVVKCIGVKNNVSYDDLEKEDFECSFLNIKNKTQLKNEIAYRYSKSMPDLTKKEILSLGVGITKFEIIDTFSFKIKDKKCFIDSLDLDSRTSMRDGFGEGMLELGKSNKSVVALTADLKGSVRLDKFEEKYKDRFYEFGIAEQNMMSAAAGMNLVGKIPFVTSFAAFNPGRNWDQLRVSVCYQNANVKVFGSHAGLTVGEDGATHQALEDIAITRCLPNMTVIVPCDKEELKKATIAAAKLNGPVYIRGSRAEVLNVNSEKSSFEIGKIEVLDKGSDVTIIACGVCVEQALIAKKKLLEFGIDASVLNMHTIKPFDDKTVLKYAKLTGCVVTVEEHQEMGGMGSSVAEFLSANYPVIIDRIGVSNTFGESGDGFELLKKYKIDSEEIVKRVKEALKKK